MRMEESSATWELKSLKFYFLRRSICSLLSALYKLLGKGAANEIVVRVITIVLLYYIHCELPDADQES